MCRHRNVCQHVHIDIDEGAPDSCTSISKARARDRGWPVAHVIHLPQLCKDEQMSGGGGFLREDNVAQVPTHPLLSNQTVYLHLFCCRV